MIIGRYFAAAVDRIKNLNWFYSLKKRRLLQCCRDSRGDSVTYESLCDLNQSDAMVLSLYKLEVIVGP